MLAENMKPTTAYFNITVKVSIPAWSTGVPTEYGWRIGVLAVYGWNIEVILEYWSIIRVPGHETYKSVAKSAGIKASWNLKYSSRYSYTLVDTSVLQARLQIVFWFYKSHQSTLDYFECAISPVICHGSGVSFPLMNLRMYSWVFHDTSRYSIIFLHTPSHSLSTTYNENFLTQEMHEKHKFLVTPTNIKE